MRLATDDDGVNPAASSSEAGSGPLATVVSQYDAEASGYISLQIGEHISVLYAIPQAGDEAHNSFGSYIFGQFGDCKHCESWCQHCAGWFPTDAVIIGREPDPG